MGGGGGIGSKQGMQPANTVDHRKVCCDTGCDLVKPKQQELPLVLLYLSCFLSPVGLVINSTHMKHSRGIFSQEKGRCQTVKHQEITM